MSRQPWIHLLEAAYDLSSDMDAWLDSLMGAALRLLDGGHGAQVQLFRLRPVGVAIERSRVLGEQELAALPAATVDAASTPALDLVFRSGIPAATMSEVVWSRMPGQEDIFLESTGGRFRDVIGIVAHTGTGTGLALNSPLTSPRTMTSAERQRWTCICAHVGAALRLRERFTVAPPEAVLDPAGELVDGAPVATNRDARECLREAVRRIARARRTPQADDPEDALALWDGLVAGRWSLVDHFEEDGKRFVVAHRNDPEVGDPRGLSRRERQVAEFAGLGRSPKEIAYNLGLAVSTVANAEARARAKLGLRTRAELASFFSLRGLRRRLVELELSGEPLLVASSPLLAETQLVDLSPAEREVALLAVQGATNAAIGIYRGSAERTVANQLHAVFEKLGVASRSELAAVLASEGDGSRPD